MGALNLEDVDDELLHRLEVRAASKGVSAEAELRAILREALKEPESRPSLVEFFRNAPFEEGDLDGVEDRTVIPPVQLG